MVGPGEHPVTDIGHEFQPGRHGFKIHRDERRVIDLDPDLFHRSNQIVVIALAPDDPRKQADQFDPPDRCAKVKPGPVAGDAHVDIAAKRRVPQMYRGRAFFAARTTGHPHGCRDPIG